MQKIIRIAVLLALLITAGLMGSSLAGCNGKPQTGNQNPDRPNIILIMTDDQPMHTMDYMPIVQKELIEKGVNFTREIGRASCRERV